MLWLRLVEAKSTVPKEVIVRVSTMYCVKCRAKRDDPNAERVTMKNGKPAMKGKCPVCGTAMFKIGG